MPFIDLGLILLIMREVTRTKEKTNDYISNTLLIKIIATIITTIVIIVVVNLVESFRNKASLVYFAYPIFIFESFNTIFFAIFRAYENMKYEALISIGERILCGSVCYFFLKNSKGIKEILWINCLSRFISLILTIIILNYKITRIKLKIDFSSALETFKNVIPFTLANILLIAFFRINTILLTIFKGDSSVGQYSGGYNMIEFSLFLPASFVLALYPSMSQYFVVSFEKLKQIFLYGLKVILFISFPISLIINLLSFRIIPLLYKDPKFYEVVTVNFLNFSFKILGSISVLRITAWMFVVVSVNLLLGTLFYAINKQKWVVTISGFAFLLHLLLSIFAIPILSFWGASLSILLSQLIVTIINLIIVSKIIKQPTYFKIFSKIILVNLILGGIVYLFKDKPYIILFPVIVFSLGIYFIISLMFNIFRKEEIKLLLNHIRGGRKEEEKK